MKNTQFCWGDYGMEMKNEILKRVKWEREGLQMFFIKRKGSYLGRHWEILYGFHITELKKILTVL